MSVRSVRAIQVHVAVPNPAVARRISRALLEARLCACVQTLGPMTSRYRWKGKTEHAREWLLLAKTRRALFPAVERAVRALHPYDVPEILGTPIERGHAPYMRWLAAETSEVTLPARRRSPAASRSKRRRPHGR